MPQSSLQNAYTFVEQAPTQQHLLSMLGPPIAAVVIAGFAAWIAFQQLRISKQQAEISRQQADTSHKQAALAAKKLKLDMFDRRMEVYGAVKEALGAVTRSGSITNQEMIDYLTGVQSAKWLFGPEVSEYLEKDFWHSLVDLQLHNAMSQSNNDQELVKHITAKSQTIQGIMKQYTTLDDLVRPYLAIEH